MRALCLARGQILSHPIFDSFLRDLETHAKDEVLDDIQQYHVDCWKSCKTIRIALDKLKIAEDCIRQSYRYCQNDHQLAEYIEFHVENYLIRSRSVYDRVLIFVNYLCDIQMAKEHVNHNSILTNRKVEQAGLREAIKRVKKTCEVYRFERNSVVHHDSYTDDRLDWVDTALKAKKILGGRLDSIGLNESHVTDAAASFLAEKMEEFRKNSERIAGAVFGFLDDAQIVYDQRAQRT